MPTGSAQGGRGGGLEAARGGFPADALPGASRVQAGSQAGESEEDGRGGAGEEGAERAGPAVG